ncbi:hypothetical protein Tery_0329 [Trichodesmium erythraeum IMS101]|uniref:Uncharacterized protein n=1 Tax=Trichodesmium erythraeum (strain IMS101) TaxID=203124 RepID=Q119M1_TRIEI|nr:hypothetical protein [Trichodesmium sp. ALOHA_ZT_67]MDT9340115.1 hypothetical protein [Trichodesmium erythraeum 21-75]
MLPKEVKNLTIVQMVKMVSINELLPAIHPLVEQILDLPGENPEKAEKAEEKIATVLTFF